MRLALIAVGQRMPGWIREGFEDYVRRLRPRLPLTLVEIPAAKRGSGDLQRAIADEGRKQLASIRPDDYVIALDERGTARSSLALSRWHSSLVVPMVSHPKSCSGPTNAGRCRR
jgi:23S rRNA (pseudouridine1915-N3)-methyltransferase